MILLISTLCCIILVIIRWEWDGDLIVENFTYFSVQNQVSKFIYFLFFGLEVENFTCLIGNNIYNISSNYQIECILSYINTCFAEDVFIIADGGGVQIKFIINHF